MTTEILISTAGGVCSTSAARSQGEETETSKEPERATHLITALYCAAQQDGDVVLVGKNCNVTIWEG